LKIKPTATFIGYQETLAEPTPLFNISGGSRDKSTVTLVTLMKMGVDVPYYPRPTAVINNKAWCHMLTVRSKDSGDRQG
jgi:hypothetical protein